MNDEIPYNPPGLDDYIREGARQNSALLMRCHETWAHGLEDALRGRCREENPYAGRGMLEASWLGGYNSVSPPDADDAAPNAALCESAGREKASVSGGTGCAPSDSHQQVVRHPEQQ